jgi:hypothetical protein
MSLAVSTKDLHDLCGPHRPRSVLHGLPVRDRLETRLVEHAKLGSSMWRRHEVHHESTILDPLDGQVARMDVNPDAGQSTRLGWIEAMQAG